MIFAHTKKKQIESVVIMNKCEKCIHLDGNYCEVYDTHCNLPECYFKELQKYKDIIKQIRACASSHRKAVYGAGGQCVGIQEYNRGRHTAGVEILKLIKDLKDD